MTVDELLNKVLYKEYRPKAYIVVFPAKGFHYKLRGTQPIPEETDGASVFIRVEDIL